MTTKGNSEEAITSAATTPEGATKLQMGLRLRSVDHSDQPVFANFTSVQGAPGMVFLDFGFLEPGSLPALSRLAQSGEKLPEAINGRLACRLVLGVDTAAQLAQQLTRHLTSQAAAAKPGSKPS
jgi:hypothetical protein